MSWRHHAAPLSLVQTAAPAEEPLSVDEAKLFLRVDHGAEDALILALVRAAREAAERVTGRQLVTATWQLKMDCFPRWEFDLPRPPLRSVGFVRYVDYAGATQTVAAADYTVDTATQPGRVAPAYGKYWPPAIAQLGAVTVEFSAGYGAAAAVPEAFKDRMRAYVNHCFVQREARDEAYLDRLFAGLWTGTYR
jgi:uncharacterized phiE125 gp8 family phage protein